jgi:hypothetical protein
MTAALSDEAYAEQIAAVREALERVPTGAA